MADNLFLMAYQQGDDLRLGLEEDYEIRIVDQYLVPSLHWLCRTIPAGEVLDRLRDARDEPLDLETYITHPPIDLQQVWAAGRTYRQSDGKSSNTADRPHLFFKALGGEVVGGGHAIGIRYDVQNSVAEPELVVLL